MNKQNIIEKIRAILNKNTENGASESESLSAIKAASKLMQKYMISEEEILNSANSDDEKFVFVETKQHYAGKTLLDRYIAVAIGKLVEAKPISFEGHIVFFGFREDGEFGSLVHNSIWWAFKAEIKKFRKKFKEMTGAKADRSVNQAFESAFGDRIRNRILEYIKEKESSMIEQDRTVKTNNEYASKGSSLIVLKEQIITQKLANMMNLKKGKSRNVKKNYTHKESLAHMMGRDAANGVNLQLNKNEAPEAFIDK